MLNGNLEIGKMGILKNNQDIRELPIYKSFILWETNVKGLHKDSEQFDRNLDIFEFYLGHTQGLYNIHLRDIGNKYNIKKERVRQIYAKYLLHFILYMFYVGNLEYNPKNDDVFTNSIELLSFADRQRVIQHFKDKKPFKYIGPRDLMIIKRTCKIL